MSIEFAKRLVHHQNAIAHGQYLRQIGRDENDGQSLLGQFIDNVMNFGFGAQYLFVPQFGAGVFFDVTKAFVSKISETDFGASGFAFGLQLQSRDFDAAGEYAIETDFVARVV